MATQRKAAASRRSHDKRPHFLNPPIGYTIGAVFLVLGIAGFFVSGDHDFAGMHGGKLLDIFEVNALHNIVNIVIGLVLILGAWMGLKWSRLVNITVGIVLLAFGVVFAMALDSDANVFALNGEDNVLHLVVGFMLLIIGVTGERSHMPLKEK